VTPPQPPTAKTHVSHEAIVQDMQHSLDLDEQILNVTDLFRQQGLLEQVYIVYPALDQDSSMDICPSVSYVGRNEINVDAPDEASRILEQAFGFSWSHANNNNKYEFSFHGKSHDNDWKEFSLHF
jgi:hypothetical protein